jgi:hypothetical protein
MEKSKVLSVRYPSEINLHARFTLAAKKAMVLPWELLEEMLDIKEKNQTTQSAEAWEKTAEEFRAEINALRAEMKSLKEGQKHDTNNKNDEKTVQKQEKEAKPLSILDANENDEFVFCVTFGDLAKARGTHDLPIADLRKAFPDWTPEKFNKVIERTKENQTLQYQAGDTEYLTPEQIAGGFIDNNGFKFLTVQLGSAGGDPLHPAPAEKKPKKQGRKTANSPN